MFSLLLKDRNNCNFFRNTGLQATAESVRVNKLYNADKEMETQVRFLKKDKISVLIEEVGEIIELWFGKMKVEIAQRKCLQLSR